MSDESLRHFGITPAFGMEVRSAGDWLESQLMDLGFPSLTIDAAVEQLGYMSGIAKLMGFDDTPHMIAENLRDKLIQKRNEESAQ